MFPELPVFPLHTVLFPGGELPLRIFELRYRRLVDECGKDKPFVIVRIREGREAGEPAFTYGIGSRAYLTQMVSQRDGTLGVLVHAEERVRLQDFRIDPDGLMMARAVPLPAERWVPVPADLQPLADALDEQGLAAPDAGLLAWRLAESLPLDLDVRQSLLEENDPERRLAEVRQWLLRHPGWFSA